MKSKKNLLNFDLSHLTLGFYSLVIEQNDGFLSIEKLTIDL